VPTVIEVFADITCPFTHAGLKCVTAQLASADSDAELIVRAWPLEWVNGTPLEAGSVGAASAALQQQLAVNDFGGFNADTWPETSIPALNLVAQAYTIDAATGLALSLRLRAELFEQGQNIADPAVLAEVAASYGLAAPVTTADPAVEADYAEGQRRGVKGSPEFWVGEARFFCPTLELSHDADGDLTAEFDPDGLREFIAQATS
jgi:predicted DsbA family dithiol-disulfide isomerase